MHGREQNANMARALWVWGKTKENTMKGQRDTVPMTQQFGLSLWPLFLLAQFPLLRGSELYS